MSERNERSLQDLELDRVSAMTMAGQQKPESHRFDDDDRFILRQKAANGEAGGGDWE